MLGQLGAGDDLVLVMNEIGQQPEFLGGELDRRAVERDPAPGGVQRQRTAANFG